jgi:hypothetical protein
LIGEEKDGNVSLKKCVHFVFVERENRGVVLLRAKMKICFVVEKRVDENKWVV